MKLELRGQPVYASTGGRDHVEGHPTLVFMHGAGSSHLVWSQQSRSFAYAGYNVLAVDFPGHNLSSGEALTDVEAQAIWIGELLDALAIKEASFIGHSQGGLVALELAATQPERVEKAVFVATAGAIPVNEMLISTAENKEPRAKASMTAWGHGPDAHLFDNSVPGVSNVGLGLRTMDLNPGGVVATDLKACAAYEGGYEKASTVQCPTLCVLAAKDKMTPMKFGKKLAEALPHNTLHILPDSGHTIPAERPIELNALLRDFLNT